MKKYLEDKFLLLRAALIATPILVMLIIQAVTYPITLHSYAQVNKVRLNHKVASYASQMNILFYCRKILLERKSFTCVKETMI